MWPVTRRQQNSDLSRCVFDYSQAHGGFALFAAVGMIAITRIVSVAAIPQMSRRELPHRIGHLHHRPGDMWVAFVSIVLALSGVEAIANLTGVMKKPVTRTANKATWVVAGE